MNGDSSQIAVVYLPGLFAVDGADELSVVGRKLAVSLDKACPNGPAVFETSNEYVDLRGGKVPVCRVQRRDSPGMPSTPVLDLFLHDYRPELLAKQRNRSLPGRCLVTAVAVGSMVLRTVRHLIRPRYRVKILRDRFQALLALLGVLAVGAYLGILVLATVHVFDGAIQKLRSPDQQVLRPAESPTSRATTVNAAETDPGGSPESAPGWARRLWAVAATAAQDPIAFIYHHSTGLFVMLTAAGLLAPGREKFWQAFTRISEELVAFTQYLSFGERRAEITGALECFVERLTESPNANYDQYRIIGYSFGSIVALDTLFPCGERRAARLDRLDTLVTIGSPHDFILTFWPKFLENRNPIHRRPQTWINVYSPIDLLASNFLNSGRKARSGTPSGWTAENLPSEELCYRGTIHEDRLGPLSWLALMGLRAHSMYWSHREDGERNCFDELAPKLLPGPAGPPAPSPHSQAPGSYS